MNYQQTVEYLYNATPQFQQIGAAAYKPGLDTARSLDSAFANPHTAYPTIHVAGTNGKGSTCHTLAAILQAQGLRTGLFTSPHLVDFRERIRVNGQKISEEAVTDFVERYLSLDLNLSPSFFELTTIMAFDYFRRENVDIAVIETGLGGRLDTTNIISPILSIITNISFDHKAQLGNTLRSIASEKAGIIKPGTPVVIGNASQPEVRDVFWEKASEMKSPIRFAAEEQMFSRTEFNDDFILYANTFAGDICGELTGDCQPENAATVLCAVDELRKLGLEISDDAVRKGFASAARSTGLMGRWMRISEHPLTICDTGHNEGGWDYLGSRLSGYGNRLKMVIGFVNDKEVDSILRKMPTQAEYFFTRASVPRAMQAEALAAKAAEAGLQGSVYPTVEDAVKAAREAESDHGESVIFVGGSTFVVADLLKSEVD